MHMPFSLLHGHFGPISIKDHGVSGLTNQRAEQCHHVISGLVPISIYCITTPSLGLSALNILNLLGNMGKTIVSWFQHLWEDKGALL